jgi:toxin secretion/phage lysis holin
MAFKLALSICGTIITFLVGGWAVSLTVLCVFMAIDIITGVMKGAIIGGLRSSIGYKGMLKKSAIMLVIILAHMLDLMIGGLPVFRTMATYFYISNEGLSILKI